jgi:putative membrane protein
VRYPMLVLKGIAFGISNLVPGLTGGVVLIIMGIYEEFVEAAGNLLLRRDRWRQYVPFLGAVGLGAGIAMVLFSTVLTHLMARYPAPMMLLFIGLLLGTVPSIIKLHNDMSPTPGRVVAGITGIALVIGFAALERRGYHADWLADPGSPGGMAYSLFTSIAAGGANVLPGVSGSYVFLLSGTYLAIMEALSALRGLVVRWEVLVPTALGAAFGVVSFSKVIDTLIKRAPGVTYYGILGLLVGSAYALWPRELHGAPAITLVLSLVLGVAVPVGLHRRVAPAGVPSSTVPEEA